jgi:deoxycytidylate deaminase
MIINAGLKEIVYLEPYPDSLAMQLLAEAKIKLRQGMSKKEDNGKAAKERMLDFKERL